MNALDYVLYRTRKTVRSACEELLVPYPDNKLIDDLEVENCSSCGVWLKPKQLKIDLDNLPICNDCLMAYGA